MYLLMF